VAHQDELLGNADSFISDLVSVAQFSAQPGGITCASAVSVELLHNALLRATASRQSTSLAEVLAQSYLQVAAELQSVITQTLFGTVIFDSTHRNVGGTVFTTQLQTLRPSNVEALQIVCEFRFLAVRPRGLTS
jgi:hypothetical protein